MIPLTRLPDWRTRLSEFIDAVRRTPFEWGTFDCGTGLAGPAVAALTGVDVCLPYRGTYASPQAAMRVVLAAGHRNLGDLVASILPELQHPSQATVGDIAAVETGSALGWSLGVVNGERIFVLRENGLATVELLTAKRAFKVG